MSDAAMGRGPMKETLVRKARFLRREIEDIQSYFYSLSDRKDLESQCFFLNLQRQDVVRGIVLQLHLALEDLISHWLKYRLLGISPTGNKSITRTKPVASRSLASILEGERSLRLPQKVELLRGLQLIDRRFHQKLKQLNRMRNVCAHNWELNILIRRGIKRKNPKRPALEYRHQNLYRVPVVKEFIAEYGSLYYKLFLKFYS
jgi:hypothetical protein